MSEIQERGYAHPETLVSTEWVAQHLNDPSVRIIESNEDSLLYSSGHIQGAVEVDWTRDLNDQLRRDYLGRIEFEALMSRIGATPETTLVIYGDKSNWRGRIRLLGFPIIWPSQGKDHGWRTPEMGTGKSPPLS